MEHFKGNIQQVLGTGPQILRSLLGEQCWASEMDAPRIAGYTWSFRTKHSCIPNRKRVTLPGEEKPASQLLAGAGKHPLSRSLQNFSAICSGHFGEERELQGAITEMSGLTVNFA